MKALTALACIPFWELQANNSFIYKKFLMAYSSHVYAIN